MKKIAVMFVLSLIIGGCSFTKMNEIDYNNNVVTKIGESSSSMERSIVLYNDTIPAVVTENSTFDVSEMQKQYNESANNLNKVMSLGTLESKNYEQQLAVQSALSSYSEAGSVYLSQYKDMIDYYGSERYIEDITQVGEINSDLHSAYMLFIDENNALVETLNSFVNN